MNSTIIAFVLIVSILGILLNPLSECEDCANINKLEGLDTFLGS